MKRIKEYIKSSPNAVLSIPAILCFIQFSISVYDIFSTHTFNLDALSGLLSSVDGFETVVLCIIMLALKRKKN